MTTFIEEKGLHWFSSEGYYMLHVAGSADDSAQGYTPRFQSNECTVIVKEFLLNIVNC